MCEKFAKVSSDPEYPSDERSTQSSVHNVTNRVHCDEDVAPPVVDWSHLAVGEITATELEVMARFEADVARRISGTADPGSSQLQLELDSDEAAGRQPRETEVISVTPPSLPLTDVITDPSAATFDSEPDSFYQSCCSVEYTDRAHADVTTPAHADDIKEQPVVASLDTPGRWRYTFEKRELPSRHGKVDSMKAVFRAAICNMVLNVAISGYLATQHACFEIVIPKCLIRAALYAVFASKTIAASKLAISGYYVWISRILVVPSTSTPPAFRQRNSLNLISICHKLAAQLLQFAPCLHLSDPVSVAQFNWAHRHMCSSTLISRTFDLVSCVPLIEREGPISEDSTTNSDKTQTTNSLTEQLTRSPVAYTFTSGSELDLEPEPCINGASLDAEVDDVGDQSIKSNTVYFQCCWPILYASLLACVVDAVRSWWPFFNNVPVDVNKDHNSQDSVVPESTPETELCVARLESLTTLIQESSSSYFAAALESGLLPFLYNVAWVLEASLVRYEDQLLQLECPSSGIRSLVPLVTTLSRLLARVTHALLNPRVPELNGTTTTNEAPFAILTLFIRHLFVLSPTPIRKENLTRRDREHKSPNPGPVTQCLVRRMLYTMVDTLTQQLDTAVLILAQTAAAANSRMKKSVTFFSDRSLLPTGTEMSNAAARVESLFKQFRWAVDFTVDTLMYTVICRALARLLVARTQPPVDAVAMDPFATYLLKLSNEDPWLLQACLNTLPRLFSSVFWSNLVDLENWLLSLMASELGASNTNDLLIPRSTRIPSVLLACDSSFGHSVLTRSSSLTELSHWHTSNVILYQLEHLFVTVRSLLSYGLDRADSGKQTTAYSQTTIATPEIFRHRDLLILAQEKSKEHWWAALPASLVDRLPTTRNRSNFPLILDLLLPSFGASVEPPLFRSLSSASQSPVLHTNVTHSLPVATTNAARSTAKRGYSTKHLATLAHRLCVDGHNAWVTAAGERRRISGPLGIILWARLTDRLAHACSLFYDPASAPGILCVDPVEGPMRQRRRMFRTHLPLADRLMLREKQTYLAHHRARHPIAALIGLPDQVNHPPERRACNWSQLSLYLPLPSSPLIHLASASRHDVQGVWACSLVGLVHIRPVEGDLILGQSWLRFQPDPVNVKDADRDSFVKAFQQQVNSVLGAYRRSPSCLSNFTDQSHQQQKIRFQQPPQHRNTSNQRRCLRRLQIAQWNWLAGRLSNFAYLMELNNAAGRTYNDLMQYPIFPWVIRDYQSAVLDLGHPGSYRDLSKPIAVQIPERAEAVAAHYADAERAAQNLLDELSDPNERPRNRMRTESQSLSISPKFVGVVCPPYHYPSHCSNEAIVLGFLVRVPPYTFRHLRFQDNNFDVPDRLFHSVATTWNLTTTTVTCVKELIPEFYFTPELFTNSAGFALGRRQLGDPVDSVILPPWAKSNARLFCLVCRAALESDYITNTLPGWIDLMFGYKQTGRRAKEALNLYHPYTYFGAIDVDVIGDPIRAQAVEAMISNYGQTPKQLFRRRPHPNRFTHQAFVIDPPPSSPTSQDTVLQSHPNDWISTPLAGSDAFLQPGNANSIENDCNALDDMVLVCHSRPTLSTYSEITPLETVIGLRWGTWAGSPHAPANVSIRRMTDLKQTVIRAQFFYSKLRVQWIRTPAAEHATHLGYLSTGVWFDPDTEDQSVDPVAVNLTAKTLEDLWDGCILHADCVESVSLDRVTRLRLPQIALNHHWQWTVLGCETNSRIWLEAGSNGPCLIKITCLGSPSDRRALSTTTFGVYMRTLNPHPDVTQSVDFPVSLTLTLPVTQPDVERTGLPFVTALTVSSMSRYGRQLFVGTRTGSIYIRQLPASLAEVTENGWIPKIMPWSFPDSTEAGLWELTAWRQLVGHTGSPIRALAACPPYGLLASGDARGGVCLWDMHRFVLISQYTTTTDANNLTKYKSDCSSTFVHVGCTDRRETSSSITGSDEDEDDSNILVPQVPPNTYPSVDGLCFNHITGELAAARWDRRTYRACWIGVYSPSGKQVTARVLDFYAEISDGSSHDLNNTKFNGATIPMAYSTVPEGRGLPQPHDTPSHVTALCFTPSLQPFNQTTHQLGEALCQGLFVADQSGYVYYLAPSASPNAAQSRTQWRNIPRKQTPNSPVIPDVNCLQKSICRGIWLSNIHSH
ncbi:Lysosomal-trafficking regulator [Fasciola gigantica]|uniref:Lysosomal-trafficking regulator n=1 Tax=Fasciola gigantica TaxID=46835 RepID=A0A504YJL2_FASGI|nr:Lysosomal-trafficking regulator [Fasciola gigantica]